MKILTIEIHKVDITNSNNYEFVYSKELNKGQYLTVEDIKNIYEFISLNEINEVIDDCWKIGYGSNFDMYIDNDHKLHFYFIFIEI